MNYKLLWISVRFENADNLIWELILNAQLLIKMVTKRSDVLWDYLFWTRLQAVNAVILDNHTSIGLPSSAATGSAMVTAKDKQCGFVLRRSLLHCLPGLCTLNNSELCAARGTTVELVRFSDSTPQLLRWCHWLHSSLQYIYSQHFLCVEFLRLGL